MDRCRTASRVRSRPQLEHARRGLLRAWTALFVHRLADQAEAQGLIRDQAPCVRDRTTAVERPDAGPEVRTLGPGAVARIHAIAIPNTNPQPIITTWLERDQAI